MEFALTENTCFDLVLMKFEGMIKVYSSLVAGLNRHINVQNLSICATWYRE